MRAYLSIILGALATVAATDITVRLSSGCPKIIWFNGVDIITTYDSSDVVATASLETSTDFCVVIKTFCLPFSEYKAFLAGTVAFPQGSVYVTDGTWDCIDHYPIDKPGWLTGDGDVASSTVVGDRSTEYMDGKRPYYIAAAADATESLCRFCFSLIEDTPAPTLAPTATVPPATTVPTSMPTSVPTSAPTAAPTSMPTVTPTSVPTAAPTPQHTSAPTFASKPEMTEVRIPFTASSKFNETTLAHDLDRLVNYTGRTEVVLASFSARLRAIETNCTMVGVAVVQAPKLDLAKTTAVIKNTTACAVYPPTADSMCRPAPKILYCGDTFVGSGTVHAIRTRGKTVAISNVTNRNTCLPNPYGVVVGVMDVYADVPAGVVVTVECV